MAEAATTRAPELETYGRSLSTIYRLGAFMVGRPLSEIPDSPEAAQARVEFYTSVEEGFGTDMELGGGLEVRDFDVRPILNGKVMAKDLKTAVSDMTEAGLQCAVETAKQDVRFQPQLTRSRWDHQNALAVDEMAQGKTAYNTRIIVSPFPEEAAAQSGDEYWRNIGYVPHLRRGFVQLYHCTADGELLAGSLSFDGSNKQRLQKVFAELGVNVPSGEVTDNWLQYAITDNLTFDRAQTFAGMIADQLADPALKKTTNTVDVTHTYRALMDQVFNESYIHISESLYRQQQTKALHGLVNQFAAKATHFNQRYKDALYGMQANPHRFSDHDSIVLHELLVYSTIEMMRALHLKTGYFAPTSHGVAVDVAYIQTMHTSMFQNMLGGFGAEGARNNRVYSACGLKIDLGSDSPEQNPQTAYGGNDPRSKEENSSEKKTMSCPFCTAKVYDDPCARVLKCWDCKAAVVDGRVVSKGDGGSKARAAARQAAKESAQKVTAVETVKQADEAPVERGVSTAMLGEQEHSKAPIGSQIASVALSAAGV